MTNPSYKINPESDDNWLANTESEYLVESVQTTRRKPYKNPSDRFSIPSEKE